MDEAEAARRLAAYIDSHSPADEVPNLPYGVLQRWTDGFADERKLGEGGFGSVYEGIAPLTGLLAVKRVSIDVQLLLGEDERRETAADLVACLQREVKVLRAFRHPNIIRLYAYSQEEGKGGVARLCLVYELARRGGLDKHLVDDDKAAQLTWQRRLRIATGIVAALNYFHNPHGDRQGQGAEAGGRAFHRDVKSANVALALDYTPKLIDCGLAKFIPQDVSGAAGAGAGAGAGGGHAGAASVFTRTGQRFGTPGYKCPDYEASGVYDARSELYSLGVVLAELLCGRRTGAGGQYFDRDSLDDGGLLADARAGPWPPGLEQAWAQLAGSCLARHAKRPASALPLLRQLRDLERTHLGAVAGAGGAGGAGADSAGGAGGGAGTGAEARDAAELQCLQQQLDALRVDQALSERERREREAAMRRECCACRDETSRDRGLDCGAGHFYCAGCFQGYHQHQLDAGRAKAFEERGCHVVCEHCLYEAPARLTPYPERSMVAWLDDEGYARLDKAKAGVLERQVAERVERERQERVAKELEAAATQAGRVLVHKRHLEGVVLCTRCPGCGGAVLDFDGCFALTCARERYGGCGTHFCAFCLVVCPQDAHAHVAACLENPNRGRRDAVFCQGKEFERRNKVSGGSQWGGGGVGGAGWGMGAWGDGGWGHGGMGAGMRGVWSDGRGSVGGVGPWPSRVAPVPRSFYLTAPFSPRVSLLPLLLSSSPLLLSFPSLCPPLPLSPSLRLCLSI